MFEMTVPCRASSNAGDDQFDRYINESNFILEAWVQNSTHVYFLRRIKMMKKILLRVVSVIIVLTSILSLSYNVYAYNANDMVGYLKEIEGDPYTYGYCLRFVHESFENVYGYRAYACCAYKSGSTYVDSTSRNIPIGACVYFAGSATTCGTCYNKAGHVGIYIGNGNIVHAWDGKVTNSSIDYIISRGYPYRGWGWLCDKSLDQYTEAPSNPWIKIDKYNTSTNSNVLFTYHADNAEYYELWLFRNGICLGNTPLPLTGSYTTKFDTAGYYQAYVSSSNSSGYIDSGKIEFNIYDNVPPDPWIYIEKDTLVVGEEVRFVYNASHVTHFSLGINRYNERIISEYRGWNETTYTTSFDKSGTYTAYISAYNDYGYADSRKITFTVHDKTIQNLGENFYGKILNKACWKPTQNENSLLKLCKEKGHSNELWRFVRQSDGSYEILSCTTGEYLIANSESKILIGNTTENTNKQWFIYNFGNGIILKPKSSEDVLTLDGGNTEIGTEIVLSPFSGNSSQIFNVYQGYDVQLTAPTLSIDAIKYDKVSFNWNSVSSPSNYKIKVYSVEDLNNPIYVDDVSIDTTSYTLKLPTGNYIASVTAYNYYQGCQSNEVKFNLTAPVSTKVTKKDNTLTFTSILNVNEAENATVLLGLYDKNNKMLNIVKDVYKNKVIFNIPYQKDIEYAKVMVWNNLSGLKPLCEAKVIPSSEFIVE